MTRLQAANVENDGALLEKQEVFIDGDENRGTARIEAARRNDEDSVTLMEKQEVNFDEGAEDLDRQQSTFSSSPTLPHQRLAQEGADEEQQSTPPRDQNRIVATAVPMLYIGQNAHGDVDQTGRWGKKVSKKEIILVVVLMMVAIIAGVVFSTRSRADNAVTISPTPFMSPTIPTRIDPPAQLDAILAVLRNNAFTNQTTYPNSAEYYADSGWMTTPQERAISWLLYENPVDFSPSSLPLMYRYALTTLYYALGGENWIISNEWLSREHICQWYGVLCNRLQTEIQQLHLGDNGLRGVLPSEINLLQGLISLILSNNHIYGEPPQLAIGSLPHLTSLFLNNNQFNGPITVDVRANGILNTIMMQSNNFSGTWPASFCPQAGQPDIFQNFGLDCDKIRRCRCCDSRFNCF